MYLEKYVVAVACRKEIEDECKSIGHAICRAEAEVHCASQMTYRTEKSESGGARRHIIVLPLLTFLITFLSTILLLNLSYWYHPEISTANKNKPTEGNCHVSVEAPMPYLRCGSPVQQFESLRQNVKAVAGFDFLAKCGDLMRHKDDKSSKPGVANNSKHKTGEAFDYNQEDTHVLLVREEIDGLTYWRTYLLCEKQDGTCGVKTDLRTENAGRVSAYVFDFTAAAEGSGWQRIPAQEGW